VRAAELDHNPKPHVHLWAFRLLLEDRTRPENASQLGLYPSNVPDKPQRVLRNQGISLALAGGGIQVLQKIVGCELNLFVPPF
jgi:hypothetical protein